MLLAWCRLEGGIVERILFHSAEDQQASVWLVVVGVMVVVFVVDLVGVVVMWWLLWQ